MIVRVQIPHKSLYINRYLFLEKKKSIVSYRKAKRALYSSTLPRSSGSYRLGQRIVIEEKPNIQYISQ